ncbi:MAG TPA: CsgG/HfaB family protein [Pyrinomonadaceae bacterium]|nr:CsgG/HfaB family protein [Pyrinomonadaceae bacterium]
MAISCFSQTNGKPTVAVVDFEIRANAGRDAGRELSDMLVNALLESEKFRVMERSNLSPVQQEQIKVLNGSVDSATGAEVGKLIGAQFLVLGSVTEFSEKKSSGVLGGLTSKINILGSTPKVVTYEAIIKFNLRVVNSTTGEIAFSRAVEKQVKNSGISDEGVYGVSLSGDFKSKAMQDAVKQAMQETVGFLTERIGAVASPVGVTPVSSASQTAAAADCSRLTSGAKAPKVMIVIPETYIVQKIPDPAAETEIIKKFVEKRFNVVDQRQIAAIRDREKVLTALRNPQVAASLGAEFGAQIIIIGEAFSERAGNQGGMISTRARVEARAIQTDNARILAADGKHGSGLDITEFISAKTSLRNAGSLLADYFIGQICQASQIPQASSVMSASPMPVQASSTVEIMVSNISYDQLKNFTVTLTAVPGVQNIVKTFTGNVARITVDYNGDAEKLADAISGKKVGLMKVNIVGLAGNKIEASITK